MVSGSLRRYRPRPSVVAGDSGRRLLVSTNGFDPFCRARWLEPTNGSAFAGSDARLRCASRAHKMASPRTSAGHDARLRCASGADDMAPPRSSVSIGVVVGVDRLPRIRIAGSNRPPRRAAAGDGLSRGVVVEAGDPRGVVVEGQPRPRGRGQSRPGGLNVGDERRGPATVEIDNGGTSTRRRSQPRRAAGEAARCAGVVVVAVAPLDAPRAS